MIACLLAAYDLRSSSSNLLSAQQFQMKGDANLGLKTWISWLLVMQMCLYRRLKTLDVQFGIV